MGERDMRKKRQAFFLGWALLICVTSLSHADEIVVLPTRNSVTQSILLSVPEKAKPAAVAVLFPGSEGNIQLRLADGEIKFNKGNFLVRSSQAFVDSGVAVAIIDTPSDEPHGMQDGFRLGEKHAADIKAVVAELKKRFGDIPVFLVGTSRGSISAAGTGRVLGPGVSGVVLTSTVFLAARRGGPGLSGFDYSTISAPVLLVHHTDDGCAYTPYRSARSIAESQKYPLISVTGGLPATSGVCEAHSAHGYLGKEVATVDAIVKWMLKQPYPENID
jgi:hypothetical protein